MVVRILIVFALVLIAIGAGIAHMFDVGQAPYAGSFQPLSPAEKTIEPNLRASLEFFTLQIGARSLNRDGTLDKAADEIDNRLRRLGYDPAEQTFTASGRKVRNLVVDHPGNTTASKVVLLGTHYDTYRGSPGAHANGSAVVALLEVARLMKGKSLPFKLRFVFLANGEIPYYGTQNSGAVNYAQFAEREGEQISFALLLDSLGYFADEPNSQRFPWPMSVGYPSEANFLVAFSGLDDRETVRRFSEAWNRACQFPLEAGSLPFWFPGALAGDHEAFASQNVPTLLLSDTGTYRHSDSGTSYDLHTPIDFKRLARVVQGIADVIPALGSIDG